MPRESEWSGYSNSNSSSSSSSVGKGGGSASAHPGGLSGVSSTHDYSGSGAPGTHATNTAGGFNSNGVQHDSNINSVRASGDAQTPSGGGGGGGGGGGVGTGGHGGAPATTGGNWSTAVGNTPAPPGYPGSTVSGGGGGIPGSVPGIGQYTAATTAPPGVPGVGEYTRDTSGIPATNVSTPTGDRVTSSPLSGLGSRVTIGDLGRMDRLASPVTVPGSNLPTVFGANYGPTDQMAAIQAGIAADEYKANQAAIARREEPRTDMEAQRQIAAAAARRNAAYDEEARTMRMQNVLNLAGKQENAVTPESIGPNSPVINGIIDAENPTHKNIKNPNSTASGLAQFTDRTWLGMMAKYHPEWTNNLSVADLMKPENATLKSQVLDMKDDPKWSRQLASDYAQENADYLAKNGIRVTPTSIYAAHVFGPKGAVSVLTANPNTPLANIIGKDVLAKNPAFGKNPTVGQVLANYFDKAMNVATPNYDVTTRDWTDEQGVVHQVTNVANPPAGQPTTPTTPTAPAPSPPAPPAPPAPQAPGAPEVPAVSKPQPGQPDYFPPAPNLPLPARAPRPTDYPKTPYQRSLTGIAAAAGIDVLIPAPFQIPALLFTGNTVGGLVWDASHGRYGPNYHNPGDAQSPGGPMSGQGDPYRSGSDTTTPYSNVNQGAGGGGTTTAPSPPPPPPAAPTTPAQDFVATYIDPSQQGADRLELTNVPSPVYDWVPKQHRGLRPYTFERPGYNAFI